MYATSFRIPFTVIGKTQFVNGGTQTFFPYDPGLTITVVNHQGSSFQAEVIESKRTLRYRDTFEWKIVDVVSLSTKHSA